MIFSARTNASLGTSLQRHVLGVMNTLSRTEYNVHTSTVKRATLFKHRLLKRDVQETILNRAHKLRITFVVVTKHI